jgi:hypothetical protein
MKTLEVLPSYLCEANEVGPANTGRHENTGNSYVKSHLIRNMIQVYSSLRLEAL